MQVLYNLAQHATNSDMIQPGLLQLQPIMDDFMDFDPFQGNLLFSCGRTRFECDVLAPYHLSDLYSVYSSLSAN